MKKSRDILGSRRGLLVGQPPSAINILRPLRGGDYPISEQIPRRIFSYRIAGKDDILETCQKISSDENNPQEI